jgi:hypothetical protein
MISLLKRLFGGSSSTKEFKFLIYDRGDTIEKNRWYRLSHWERPNFLKYDATWSKDWKVYSAEENIAGVTHEDRQRKFLELADKNDFTVYLEREQKNKFDKNAIKVMVSASEQSGKRIEQLGYLSKEIAKELKNEPELDARPNTVLIPVSGSPFSLTLKILVRSQAYKKKQTRKGEPE